YPTEQNPAVNLAIRSPGSSTPFPNNIIPPSLIPQVSKNVLTWKDASPFQQGGFIAYPNIDAQARAIGSPINLAGTTNDTINSDQFLGRGDHRFGDNDRIFARYLIVNGTVTDVPLEQVTRSSTVARAQNLAIGYSKIISPTVLND